MSTNKGCAPCKSSLIGLGSARDYDGFATLHVWQPLELVEGFLLTNRFNLLPMNALFKVFL